MASERPPAPDIPTSPTAFAGPHDHARCIHHALVRADTLCRERGVRLTAQRARVLELVWGSHQPVGAYELLERLRAEGLNAAPPTVYRALEFLLAQGLIHRIESLSAYVGCTCPGERHGAQFLICDCCHAVAELADDRVSRTIRQSGAGVDFQVGHQTVEVHGVCRRCRDGRDD